MDNAFTVEPLDNLFVLRDDLIAGGTKRRALDLCLNDIPQKKIFYAGTIFGHGALALAQACKEQNKQAHLYLSSNDAEHPMLKKLRDTGAKIHRAGPVPVDALLDQATREKGEAHIFPLGFDAPAFHSAMSKVLREFDISPYSEIWCPAVSGTMARALKSTFTKTPIKVVAVTKDIQRDHTAPEKYHQPALTPPPYPSCPYTDAKVWQFAQQHAKPGALIWNIAG